MAFPRFVVALACALSAVAASAMELPDEIRFDYLGVEDGLSSSSVSAIVQDDEGFVWLATQSGLDRYDGYSVERHENDPFDANSLSHNLIQTLCQDHDGTFWIGTYGGLNHFDPRTRTFTLYENEPGDPDSLSNNVVVAIGRDRDGTLWVGTLGGLNRLDADSGTFVRYLPDPDDAGSIPDKVVRSIHRDARGELWVGTYGGLSRYVPAADAFVTVGVGDAALPSPYVMSIIDDPHDDAVIWVGSWGGGVSRVDTVTGAVGTITLPHNEVYTQMFDSAGRLWAGTWGNGLYVVDPATGSHVAYTADATGLRRRLSHDVVYALLEDDSGVIWVGTNGGGVNKYVPWHNQFQNLVHNPDDANSLSAGKVNSIHVDPDGTTWFGVYNGGLNRYDPATGRVTRYRHDPADPESLSNDIVNVVFRDSAGRLWVGTNDGLNLFDTEREVFERRYTIGGSNGLPEAVVYAIGESPDGELWIGTNTHGVIVQGTDGSIRVYSHDPDDPSTLSDNLVRRILHDSSGEIWVGTNNGLNRYDPERDGFRRYHHEGDEPGTLSSNNIRDVHEDRMRRLWVATAGGGVNRFDRATGTFSFLSTNDGLASNHVLGVVEDARGSLWLPTNRGISIYDPHTESFRSLNTSSGLLSNELTDAVHVAPDGNLYFGSVAGATIIDAVEDAYAEYAPPLALTSAEVLGRPRDLSRREDGSYAPLVLEYGENFFTLEFAALDYADPSQNSYAYTLEGFDTGWISTGNRNFASYTNLNPGDYLLRVRGAGSRANWNDAGISLPIVVRPPWWGSRAAYFGYAFAGVVVLFLVALRVLHLRRAAEERMGEQERINRELEEKVAERTAEIERARALAERATREKSLFLANMSHEIRTPLNGMMGMLSLLARTPLERKQREYLRYTTVSAENLNVLVSDMLDFERIEAGELRLVAEPFSLREVVSYLHHLFVGMAEDAGLNLRLDVDLGSAPDRVSGDRGRLVQVLTNLVSNAIKYTERGEITIRLAGAAEPGAYRFEVEDTGVGIVAEHLDAIFERFRQLELGHTKRARGVGLGLAIVKQVLGAMGGSISVESEPGRGSRFVVAVPFAAAAESPEAECAHAASDEHAPAPDAAESDAPQDSGILVCEDEAINRLYLEQHLRSLGYRVEVATNGVEAVEKACGRRYRAVLMDLGMPKVSGLEASRQIRAWEESNGRDAVPIVALTAHTYEADVQRCFDAGMNAFVSKPINEAELHEALAGAIS